MKLIGIDPGLSGAIAILEDKKVIKLLDMPIMAEGKKNKRQLNSAQLVTIISENIKWKEERNYPNSPDLVSINEVGRKALEKINELQNEIVEETLATGDYTNQESDDRQFYEYLQQQVESDDYFRYM